MNIKEHIRSASWCFLMAMAFVVLMVSAPGSGAHQVVSLAHNDHFFSAAHDDAPVTEISAQHAKPKHSALRVKIKTKVFLKKTDEIPGLITATVSHNVYPYQAYPDANDAKPDYYNFLFRYTPF